MSSRKLALVVVLLGLLCLPAPLYLDWTADATAPTPRTSQVYTAHPVDPANETGRQVVLDYHRVATTLSVHQVSHRYSAGEYRAPNVTRRTLEDAMRNGSATTDHPGATADLRRIARNETFVYDAYAEVRQFYRLQVTDHGSVVRARNVSDARVANETVERTAVRHADLSQAEERTVDRILANSSEDDWGYRPRVDDAFADRLPALVRKEGTLYSLHATGHVDDFGSGFARTVVGFVVAGLGAILLLGGSVGYVVAWRRGVSTAD